MRINWVSMYKWEHPEECGNLKREPWSLFQDRAFPSELGVRLDCTQLPLKQILDNEIGQRIKWKRELGAKEEVNVSNSARRHRNAEFRRSMEIISTQGAL